MPDLSSFLSNAIEKLLFRPVTVLESELLGSQFRLVRLQGEGFRDVKWTPGQSVQFFLGNLTKRAYTPMNVDPAAGSAQFLFHLHGGGPGSRWAAAVKFGDLCQVMRPKDSLDFNNIQQDSIFFGDDTSLAAAHTLQGCTRKTLGRRSVLEVVSTDEARLVAGKLALNGLTLVQKEKYDSHLDKVAATLAEHASALQTPQQELDGERNRPGTQQSEGLLVARKDRHGLKAPLLPLIRTRPVRPRHRHIQQP